MIGSSVGDGRNVAVGIPRRTRADLRHESQVGYATLQASSSAAPSHGPASSPTFAAVPPSDGASAARHGAGVAAPRRERPQSGPAVPDRLLHVACDRDAVQHAQPLPLLPLVLFEQVLPCHGTRMLRTARVLPRTTRPSRHVVFTARSIPLASKRGLGAHPSKIYGAAAPALTLTLSLTRTLPDPWHSCSGSNPDPRLNPSLNPDRELLQVSSRLRR